MTQIQKPQLKIDILLNLKGTDYYKLIGAGCNVTIVADLGETVIIEVNDLYENIEVYKSILK